MYDLIAMNVSSDEALDEPLVLGTIGLGRKPKLSQILHALLAGDRLSRPLSSP
jgi:hypothetical protein